MGAAKISLVDHIKSGGQVMTMDGRKVFAVRVCHETKQIEGFINDNAVGVSETWNFKGEWAEGYATPVDLVEVVDAEKTLIAHMESEGLLKKISQFIKVVPSDKRKEFGAILNELRIYMEKCR